MTEQAIVDFVVGVSLAVGSTATSFAVLRALMRGRAE